ncbi:MAG: DUF2461 domain-containing protein [Bacteroidales bacterium]|nr:DUF2461 domain-containing protein [Bacteroidales bacterium]
MISSDILNYLKKLSKNNNKEWFHANKPMYEKVRKEFEFTVQLLVIEIGKFDKTISGLTAKDCVFRIFRDVRFSSDKTPYKTNFGAFMAPGGRKSGRAGYYLHVEPGNYFLAGGIYMPPSDILKKVRYEIFHNLDEFEEIIHHAGFKKYFGQIWGNRLSAAPRGFPKDFKGIDYLKYKDYNMVHELNEATITGEGFIGYAAEVFRAMLPLNRFINQAITGSI